MKPIRNEQKKEVARNPWQGKERPTDQEETDHVVSDHGGIESCSTHHRIACDCGCLAPPGGYCAVCGALACTNCFDHCDICRAPTCARHGLVVELPPNGKFRLCPTCRDEINRRRSWKLAARLLLSPFIRFEEPGRDG